MYRIAIFTALMFATPAWARYVGERFDQASRGGGFDPWLLVIGLAIIAAIYFERDK